jgi:hypothetical protein
MTDLPIYVQFIIIFLSQYLFIYFRTKNVEANAERNRLKLFYTGMLVNLTWLISIALGVNAILHGHWILVLANLSGGLLGADHAITNKFKKKS